MPDRKRVTLQIEIDLDPVIGAMHTEDSARYHVQMVLTSQMAWYNPEVKLPEK